MRNVRAPRAPLTIRPATAADVSAVAALEVACFAPGLSLKHRQLRYLLGRPSAVFLVAESAGRVVGEGIALVRRTAGPNAAGRVYSLAVDAEHRGRQVGRDLLAAIVDAMAARRVGRVYLEVDRTNGSAVALYHGAGFAPVGTLADYYGPGRHALRMVRDLRPVGAAAA